MTSTTGHDRPGSGPQAAEGGRGPTRDRSVLLALPEAAPAAPVLRACLLAAASLAVLCVLAVLVPAPVVRLGPLSVPGGGHDLRVLVFLTLVGLAGTALGIGLLRGALPRAEAAGAAASVDRSALSVRPAQATVLRVARAWALLVAGVVLPAWLGLLPLPVVGLVLPFAVAACAPAVLVRRAALATARRRGLAVLAPGAAAALAGNLVVAGPERPAPEAVVLTGMLLAPAPGREGRRGPGGRTGSSSPQPPPAAAARAGGRPPPGEWGFQAGPGER